MRAKQIDLFEHGEKSNRPRRIALGGTRSHAKIARPLDRKRPMHIVLKSTAAKGRLSLLTHRLSVERILKERARQFHVTIHAQENMGNHLHIVASFACRSAFQNFLRTATALIARAVTGARKGSPFGRRFWDQMAFTRVVMGWRDRLGMETYLRKNRIEREFGSEARAAFENLEAVERISRRNRRSRRKKRAES